MLQELFSLSGDHCFRLRSGTDFVDGAVTIAANGSPAAQVGLEFLSLGGVDLACWQDGCSANTYAMTSSMPAP